MVLTPCLCWKGKGKGCGCLAVTRSTHTCGRNVLKMNFSVDVNMYREKVTSYWYRLRWNQRSMVEGYSMAARRSAEAEAKRTPVARDVVSTIGNRSYRAT